MGMGFMWEEVKCSKIDWGLMVAQLSGYTKTYGIYALNV